MNLHEWIDQRISDPDAAGRSTWLADKLGVSKTAVSLWRDNGVPLTHMPAIVDLTAGAVSIEDMVMHAAECRERNAKARAA